MGGTTPAEYGLTETTVSPILILPWNRPSHASNWQFSIVPLASQSTSDTIRKIHVKYLLYVILAFWCLCELGKRSFWKLSKRGSEFASKRHLDRIQRGKQMRNVRTIRRLVNAGLDHADWYQRANRQILAASHVIPYSVDQIAAVLALTSPRTSVALSVRAIG